MTDGHFCFTFFVKNISGGKMVISINSSPRTVARVVCIRGADPVFSNLATIDMWQDYMLGELVKYNFAELGEEIDFSTIAMDGILRRIRERRELLEDLKYALEISLTVRKANIVFLVEYTCCVERRNYYKSRNRRLAGSLEAKDVAHSLDATTQQIGRWYKKATKFSSNGDLVVLRCVAEIEPTDDYRYRKVIRFRPFESFGTSFRMDKRSCRNLVRISW